MGLGRARNRRRQDIRARAEEVRGAVKLHGGTVLRALLAAALTGGLAVGAWALHGWALRTPTFALERVTFTGLRRATGPELERLAGLARGQNLFLLDSAALARAMAAHPWIQRVEVTRHFPRGLSVEARERVPVAMVALPDLYLLDRDAEPFKRVQPDDALDLPLITGVNRDEYMVHPENVAPRLKGALEIAEAYAASPAAKRAPLSELRLADEGIVLVAGADGQEIHLGEGQTPEKLARLAQLRAALEARSLAAEVIHLENRTRPGWVAVRLADPSKRTITK